MSERRLAAIMFTDIVGYTALMGESEQRALRAREKHRELLGELATTYGGRIVDENGDELVLIFGSALDAVNCALAAQSGLAEDPDLTLRIGIHSGDVVLEGARIYGDGINVASRIRPLAAPGGIAVSDQVHDSIKNQASIEITALGPQDLKNVDRPVAVFAVAGAPSAPRATTASASQGRRRSWMPIAAAAIVLIVIGAGWWLSRPGTTAAGSIRSIAVLPLDNLSGDPGQEYFVDGMTEILIADLARVRGLRVISRTSSMAYRSTDKTLPQIARELKVDAIVEGSVLRAGDRVRITAQLIEAASDVHLWSDSYEHDLENVLAVQSEVAKAIAGEIELQLSGPDEPGQASRAVDPEALDAYLKGRHLWNRRTAADLRKSIGYFESAIALDPDWALAHSGLAEANVVLSNFDPSVQSHDSMPRARAAAERAIELDDDLAPAHTALAGVRHFYEWDWSGAETEFKRALEIDKSYAPAHQWYSALLQNLGRPEGIAHAQRARELEPLAPVFGFNLGMGLHHAREYDRAIEVLRETLELNRGFLLAETRLVQTYTSKGMHDEAIEAAERFARTESVFGQPNLALAYAGAGRRDDAFRILEGLRSTSRPVLTAYAYAVLGDADLALEWLEKAYEARSVMLASIRVNPLLDSLHGDPRFDDLLRRIGFPES